jgi:predicted ATP-dependent serine protease
MQELVKMYGGEEGVGKDYWLDLQNEMSTSNSTLVFYVNGEAAYEALLPYSKA